MRKISVFDTTISDYNLGNQIIMEGVYEHLNEIFPEDFFFKVPYMEITRHTIGYLKRSDLKIFGGTNSLSGQMERYNQWDLTLAKSFQIKDVILMGLGWWQYEDKISWYTRTLLRRVLSHTHLHSVRDSHTLSKLRKIGFTNVVNTGCPTLWKITPEHCSVIPVRRASEVMLTFTDYHKDPERDRFILNTLEKAYERIYYWIQGEGDLAYIKELGANKNITMVSPHLRDFDKILATRDIDYVGTRLHAGVRAIQYKRRTLIIGIDNRAIEMSKDFNLPVLRQDEIKRLESSISGELITAIRMPFEEIRKWKSQFKE